MKEPRQFTREEIEQSEKVSQELGSGLFVHGISELPRETPRILDIDIVTLMKKGLIAEAEKAVYLYRNQWLEKVNKLRLDLEQARKDQDELLKNTLLEFSSYLHRLDLDENGHEVGMMELGFDSQGQINYGPLWLSKDQTDKIALDFISRIEQSKKEQGS